MTHRCPRLWTAHLLLALAACVRPDHEAEWCVESPGAVVMSSGEVRTLTLSEVWKRGENRQGEVLARPFPPAVHGAWIAIPDPGARTVVVLDTAGVWRGPVTSVGRGPGETMLPVATTWQSDGVLALLDLEDMSIVRLQAPSFELLDDARVSAPLLNEAARLGELPTVFLGDRLRIGVEVRARGPDGRLSTMLGLDRPDGGSDSLVARELPTISPTGPYRSWIAPGHPLLLVAPGPAGVLALAGDTDGYRVRILGSALRDSLVICRTVVPAPLTRGELGDTLRESTDFLAEALRGAPRPSTPFPLGRLFFGADGHIWVQRDRPNPYMLPSPPEGAEYDLFRPDGQYWGTVTAPPRTVLHGQVGSLVIGYERGDFDEISVVGLRLTDG